MDWEKAITQPTQKIEIAQTTMNQYRQKLQETIPKWIDFIKKANEHDIQKQTITLTMRIGVAIVREGDVCTEYQKAKKYSEVVLEALDELSDESEINDGFYLKEMNRMKQFREEIDDMWKCYLILMLEEAKNQAPVAEARKEEDDDDDEIVPVREFYIGEQLYLKGDDNILYDAETHDEVGIWNPETQTIDDIPDEE